MEDHQAYMAEVGSRIRRARERRYLSLDALSAKMQVRGHDTLTLQRIHDIEMGKRVILVSELVNFARVLRVPITELLGVPDYAPE